MSGCRSEVQARIDHAPSPLDGVKDVYGVRAALCGDQAIIHGGRPASNYSPPPALFHPALAMFDHHLRHLDDELEELTPDPLQLYWAHFFIQESLSVYYSDDDRSRAVDEAPSGSLRAYLYKYLPQEHSGSTAGRSGSTIFGTQLSSSSSRTSLGSVGVHSCVPH